MRVLELAPHSVDDQFFHGGIIELILLNGSRVVDIENAVASCKDERQKSDGE